MGCATSQHHPKMENIGKDHQYDTEKITTFLVNHLQQHPVIGPIIKTWNPIDIETLTSMMKPSTVPVGSTILTHGKIDIAI